MEKALNLPLPNIENLSTSIPAMGAASKGILLDCADYQIATTQRFLRTLETAFAEPFALVNVETGEVDHAISDTLSFSYSKHLDLLSEVARRGKPEIVEDVSPLVTLAIPLPITKRKSRLVAVATFVQLSVDRIEQLQIAAEAFDIDAADALNWISGREIWSPRILIQLATALLEKFIQKNEVARLRGEINEAVCQTTDAYVEIELLHRLARNLHLSDNATELWKKALVWLSESVQAECLAIAANQHVENHELTKLFADKVEGIWIQGKCSLEAPRLRNFLDQCEENSLSKPIVLNQTETAQGNWRCPEIRELICVPVKDGEQILAWILAINCNGKSHNDLNEFSSVEQRLLSSVGTILGIHSCNFDLYRKQSELFSSLVLSMTSALDAKDRYTSGHSDRVAKMSVALAEHLGFDKETIETIHLGGLLHDIGKIGIDDNILNKSGKLTPEEFEHIQQHPLYGHEILSGIRQLDKILPIVLHHHENWDGTGYPHGLAETEIPEIACVVAVADAYDAMSSNRPYRDGLSDAKIKEILRMGAGTQWDPKVVDAFFAIHEEILPNDSDSNSLETSQIEYLVVD